MTTTTVLVRGAQLCTHLTMQLGLHVCLRESRVRVIKNKWFDVNGINHRGVRGTATVKGMVCIL